MKNIKAIIFDFGGTLDTNGIHWSEKFWEAYVNFNIMLPKDEFRKAFVYSERKIPQIIEADYSLLKTYKTQLNYQLEYLVNQNLLDLPKDSLVKTLSEYCYQSVTKNVLKTRAVLQKLKENFSLGLVSNYYGNVKTVLKELNLLNFFDVVVDSALVGIRKPDVRIFTYTISALNVKPGNVIVIGDSYKNDIAPAKSLGTTTIWLKGKGWENHNDSQQADATITSIDDLPQAINKIFTE